MRFHWSIWFLFTSLLPAEESPYADTPAIARSGKVFQWKDVNPDDLGALESINRSRDCARYPGCPNRVCIRGSSSERNKSEANNRERIRAPFSTHPLRYGRPGVRDFVGNRCSFAMLRTDHVVKQVAKCSRFAPSCSSHATGPGLTPGAVSTSISLKNFFDKCLCPDRCAVRKISDAMPQRFG